MIIVIGAGPAGIQASITLAQMGVQVVLFEKEEMIGGKLRRWDRLFPSFTPADEVLYNLIQNMESFSMGDNPLITIKTGVTVVAIDEDGRGVTTDDGIHTDCRAVIIASGYELFGAQRKEEYGYGIYPNVVTSADLEQMFKEGRLLTEQGTAPRTVALLHCVGSRDEKVAQYHCSRVCCITAVKQAIEIRQALPETDVYCFYMDMRMFGPGYEELYKEAQLKYGIHFVRGRISEAAGTIDKRIQLKAEDTLIGRPLKMTVDMFVLMIGMRAGAQNANFASLRDVEAYQSGFLKPLNQFDKSVLSACPRIFFAGAVTAPKNIGESVSEGIAAAYAAFREVGAPPRAPYRHGSRGVVQG